MPAPYSLDLRRRVLAAARDDHLAPGVTAARFRVGESTVRLWLRRERETGSVAAKPHGGGMPPRVGAAGAPVLEALVEDKTERTLAELAEAAWRPTWRGSMAARRAAGAPGARSPRATGSA